MKRFVLPALVAIALWFGAVFPANATACSAGCIQWNKGQAFAGTTATASLTSVVAGHVIIANYCVDASALTVTIFDGINTYTAPAAAVVAGTNSRCGTTFALNAASGSPIVTATASGVVIALVLWVEEWSGIVSTSALDGTGSGLSTAGSGSAGQTYNSGNWTTSSNGDLIYGFSSSNGGSVAGSGFTTSVSDTSTGYTSVFATQSGAGSINAPFATIGVSFNENDALGIALKQTGGGGPTCKGKLMLLGVGC